MALVVASGRDARADGSQAAAQALFEDGRRLMGEGKFSEACPKFADSEKLDPAPGTLLNLAKCYEKNGQSASAWVTFKDAEAVSRRTGHQDWAGMAHDRAQALAPKLLRLTINVPPTSELEGLQLTRDGSLLARSEWNTPIPVDPGSHTVEATAPSTRKWTTTVTVDPSSSAAVVTIPQLEVERQVVVGTGGKPEGGKPEPPPPPPPVDTAPSGSGQKIAGYAVGGAGVVGLALGSVFGLIAKSKNDQALQPQNCRTSTYCTPQGLSLTSDAKSAGNLSSVFFVAGGVLAGTGLVLVLAAPSSKAQSTRSATALRLVPHLAPGAMGMGMEGSW